MRTLSRAACLFVLLALSLPAPGARAQEILGNRSLKLTLIPDYVDHTVRFAGSLDVHDPAKDIDLEGLPLDVERQWKRKGSSLWNITGTIRDGKVLADAGSESYELRLGPVHLQPNDRLSLILPFVNLDYAQIQPPADEPDAADQISRQRTHLFSYSAGDSGREVPEIHIPFTPVVLKADLRLVPLIGEVLIGKSSGLRFHGSVQFENIRDFEEFSRYCQITSERIQNGDYRAGHLIYSLDSPAYFAPDVLNSIYSIKPTRIALRTALSTCQYDHEKGVGKVQATFMGRVITINQKSHPFPPELQGSDFPDGNYSFSPRPGFQGVKGYEIVLGKIFLAPGDVLTITIPDTQIQLDGLRPHPDVFGNTGDQQIVYAGPKSFQLHVPYVPQTTLYTPQFPSILRLSFSLLESQLGSFYPLRGAYEAWLLLALGLLLYLLAGFLRSVRGLSSAAWLLISLSFYYGVRGSFGLLCVAIVFYLHRVRLSRSTAADGHEELRKTGRGLAGFVLVALGVYFDVQGTNFFRGLSGPELSPLTPVVLMILVGALFLLLYGGPVKAEVFTHADLPVLILFLSVLALYDALDKSLLALLILLTGGWYILHGASGPQGVEAAQNENPWGRDLQRRWDLAFGNRIVPLGILILMIFATLHNLSSPYANDLQVLLPALLAPLVVPVLAAVSVFIAFSSIAWLFILVFPFLPFRTGYLKAGVFALLLFAVFLLGMGTESQLIDSLSTILIGRLVYYISVPMLIGVYLDINEFMEKENKRLTAAGEEKKPITLQVASGQYFKNLQGILGTLVGIVSLIAPTVYTYLSGEPAMVTYFDLLEKLISLPI